MKRKTIATLFLGALSLLTALPALAAVPEFGTVIEGHGVPGIELGFAREQVEAAYGEPTYCQSGETAGDAAYCTWILADYIGQGGDGNLVRDQHQGSIAPCLVGQERA